VEVMRSVWAFVEMHPAIFTGAGLPISAPLAPTSLVCCPSSEGRPVHRTFPIWFPDPMKGRSVRSAGEFIRRCRRCPQMNPGWAPSECSEGRFHKPVHLCGSAKSVDGTSGAWPQEASSHEAGPGWVGGPALGVMLAKRACPKAKQRKPVFIRFPLSRAN
jgi:hypothetical protein